jgi:hypothetical protein
MLFEFSLLFDFSLLAKIFECAMVLKRKIDSDARFGAQSGGFRSGASTSPIVRIGLWLVKERTGGKPRVCLETNGGAAQMAGLCAFVESASGNFWPGAT